MAPQYILGISAYYHDSAACLLRDGAIVAAAQEERFTRKKGDSAFPARSVAFCLKEAGITATDLTPWVSTTAAAQVRADHGDVSQRGAARLRAVPHGRADVDEREIIPGQGIETQLGF